MFKGNSKFFVACEDSASFAGIPQLAAFPEDMPRIPNKEEVDAVNFSDFWNEHAWSNAVMAASSAAIIVVSLSGRADLPIPVRRWMESWPNFEQERHTTLVVVFGTEPGDGSRQSVLISYFQQIAASHGLKFFYNSVGAIVHASRTDEKLMVADSVLGMCARPLPVGLQA